MTAHANSAHVRDVTTAEFLSAVVERSRETPVLVDFWAAWCGPCRALGPILEKLATEYSGGFELVKIDTEKEPALATQFQIRSIPTVTLFKDGAALTGFQGALPEGRIRAFLAQHGIEVGGATQTVLSDDPVERVAQLRAAMSATPTRDSLKLELALALLATGALDEAARMLEVLPSTMYLDPKAVRARARLALQRRADGETNDARHAAAVRMVLDGDRVAGLEQLLELLREERHDEESPARAALVEAFQVIEDDALVRDWRRRMAAVLF
ncbi:MAG: thioredoxin [Gemmatimonadaceae bacterium]|nr:thioredoxin [Gemmatimonadaceae bacterium]